MTKRPNHPVDGSPDVPSPPPHERLDELDVLLRSWHSVNADRAAAGRDRLMARLGEQRRRQTTRAQAADPVSAFTWLVRTAILNRYAPVAASLLVLVAVVALLIPGPAGKVYAEQIMVPEAGRLDALDDEGNVIGPCPLQHTDVDVQVSGFLSRVNLTQTYHNPYESKIEAVYTFPMSHRSAVDRMTMTIGDRVVVGEVKEREAARQIYEAARKQGYVAGLLEQERPNIFTQSVANIEPGAQVVVSISYVEVLQSREGTYTFDFPMVVGPRYIPGAPTGSPSIVPAELTPRQGVVLLAPAQLSLGAAGNTSAHGTLQAGKLAALLHPDHARPIAYPGDDWWGSGDATGGAGSPVLWYRFEARYPDGSAEPGELYTDGTGRVGGRWFYTDPARIKEMGTGFAGDTGQVPDASSITPEPVKPGTRAGHDIDVTVTIDTGGPGLLDIDCRQHEIVKQGEARRADGLPRSVTLALAHRNEIPNRDFVLNWRQTSDSIQEAVFTHTAGELDDFSGGFFTLILQPPDRVAPADVPPRELIFVMDVSGSMQGLPIEKSKAVMTRAIDAMRPVDTFNVITFAGRTAVLWDSPRPANAANRAEASRFVETQQGGGGTEMMNAINAALVQAKPERARSMTPDGLADLPADGRVVTVEIDAARLIDWPPPYVRSSWAGTAIRPTGGPPFQVKGLDVADLRDERGPVQVTGRWVTWNQRRVLEVDYWQVAGAEQAAPMRIVTFLTDGYVGNDMAIIDAVRANADTTRVFSFGIGNSVNRYLLEGMARAGRGEVEFVLLDDNADQAVDRFVDRIQTPVLTDIELSFSDGLQVTDLLPAAGAIPDLFDARPLVVQGRYAQPGTGTLTIRGRTGRGPYERTIELELPETQPEHDVIATLWARAMVDRTLAPHLAALQQEAAPPDVRNEVIALGEQFRIMTPFTSFVAVEKARMTIGGEPMLVSVPIEMPDGVSYEGVFGELNDEKTETAAIDGRFKPAYPPAFMQQTNGRIALTDSEAISMTTPGSGGAYQTIGGSLQSLREIGVPGEMPRIPLLRGVKRAAPGTGGGFGGGSTTGRRASGESSIGGSAARPPLPGAAGEVQEAAGDAPSAGPAAGGHAVDRLGKDVRVDEAASGDDAAPSGKARSLDAVNEVSRTRSAVSATAPEQEAAPDSNAPRPLAGADKNDLTSAERGQGDRTEEGRRSEAKQQLKESAGIELDSRDALRRDDDGVATAAPAQEPDAAFVRRRLTAQERSGRISRVLDPSLLAMIPAAQAGKPDKPQEILVTVLVTEVSDATIKALTRAGLSVEATAKSLPIVVGRIATDDLESLALLDGVRRIEPTHMKRKA